MTWKNSSLSTSFPLKLSLSLCKAAYDFSLHTFRKSIASISLLSLFSSMSISPYIIIEYSLTESLVDGDVEEAGHDVDDHLLGDPLLELGTRDQPEVVEVHLGVRVLAVQEANQ